MRWRDVGQASCNIVRKDSLQNITKYLRNNTAHQQHQALRELDRSTMKTKALRPLKPLGTICPMTQWHIPEYRNLQKYHGVTLRSYNFQVLKSQALSRSGGQAIREETVRCSYPTTERHVPPNVQRHHRENHKPCDVQVLVYFFTFAEV